MERVLTLRELNRATLARQLLLSRSPVSVPRAIERVCALQAQWPTAPYVGLWSRVRDFDRAALTRALEERRVLRSTLMRVTIHMVSARDALALAPLWQAWRRETLERAGVDVDAAERALRRALANGPRAQAELRRELGDAYSLRVGPVLPLAHVPPAGGWRHHGRTRLVEAESWLGARLGDPADGARLLVERYLAAFGPASRADLIRFSGLRVKDVAPGIDALEHRLRRFRDDDGRALLDLAGAPLPRGDTPVPPRFLGRWDNTILGYERRARILPDAFADRKIGLAGDQVVLVDGFVAGIWRVERTGSEARLTIEALAPIRAAARREVENEASALVGWHEPDARNHVVRWS